MESSSFKNTTHDLLKNLENEDLVTCAKDRIPSFLRYDKDVIQRTEALNQALEQYTKFDVPGLAHQINNTMKEDIQELSQHYNEHKDKINRQFQNSQAVQAECNSIKDEVIQMRLKKQKALVGIQEQSDLYLEKFSKDNQAKDSVRHEISQIEEQLRQVEG